MSEHRLPARLRDRLRIPAIAAPMLRVSGPELVVAACRAGVVGAFPTANARSPKELSTWLEHIGSEIDEAAAPVAANLIVRSPRLKDDLAVLVEHQVPVVITSVGSPARVVGPLHEAGSLVLADVATLHHSRRAVDDGADGLVLLTAGSGGQTGWINPLAFVRAVREFYGGPVILAGGITDGATLAAIEVLGCDLGYMGTAFLATHESRADPDYKQMVVDADLDDVILTKAFTGLPTSMLRASVAATGLDPSNLDEHVTPAEAAGLFGSAGAGPRRWSQVWSAGHTVSGVRQLISTSELVDRLSHEYARARSNPDRSAPLPTQHPLTQDPS
ncbi:2-nitropropane dioxygenase [Streptomyces humidus]|uniref:2-nitropropane dioxygenase n=1 Tax=Streptomyces humidus TaxID=52259 RepID=A0A918LAS2_9ACTN|nr:nitronate monooxygenase [Streptomyces humidus]GGS27103.1 2-nitropropane dioxygenase [Streptomyces humidus]